MPGDAAPAWPRTCLWERYAPLMRRVEKPARYLGGEWGSLSAADKSHADYHAVMVYPDVYEIGQSNQAVPIIAGCLNTDARIFCERAYLPWTDLAALMRAEGLPLASLETYAPLADFDFVGITLPHELAATNVLELLDLAGIPLHAADRAEDDPLVFAGGPCSYNPEPFAPFFDAVFIGEGEESDLEAALLHREMRDAGASRVEILRALAGVEGLYVPSLYEELPATGLPYSVVAPACPEAPARVSKRVVADFAATDPVSNKIVPFMQTEHDRLCVEVLRGCARGCRFCQAGTIYRPVRERPADQIVAAVAQGLAATGYDEVGLSSLSTTDHSSIEEILRRLNARFSGAGVGISVPSQRVDAFGVELARLVAGEKRGSITLAPEAGTQRMRDAINKGVGEEQIFSAVRAAAAAGWKGVKLYFMVGLPGETDEDVAAIGGLCERLAEAADAARPEDARQRFNVSASVALFIPKPMTPFQWDAQLEDGELAHRIEVLRAGFTRRCRLKWHSSKTSYVEAALARGGRECAALVERAWRAGARFDAWTEQFRWEAWEQAGLELGMPVRELACRPYDEDAPLPWDHISCGVDKDWLLAERARSLSETRTPDCTFDACSACGVCPGLRVKNVTEHTRVAAGEGALS